jgi:hypothetical protein
MEATIDLQWRKSPYSGNGGQCVEVGNGHQVVMVRDSKNRDAGTLTVSADDWRQFIASVKREH